MAPALCSSKPHHLPTPKAHKPTLINLLPNNVSIHSPSSFSGANLKMRIGDYSLMPSGPISLHGAGPGILAMTGRRKRRVPTWRSLTLESLRSGTASLEVLLDAKRARLDPGLLDDAESEFRSLLSQDLIELHDLKRVAWKLEMGRKEDAAVKMLTEALERFQNDDKGSHEIYETKLLLIEMLIYQGDYKKAKKTCLEVQEGYKAVKETAYPPDPNPDPTSVRVQHVGPTDYKLQLYQAVLSFMSRDEKEAKKHWDEFNRMIGRGFGGSGPPKTTMDEPFEEDLDHHGLTFAQFQDHMKVLMQEIVAARKRST